MQFGEVGPRVGKLQQKLMDLGYQLPIYGADKELGDETISAAFDCITDLWPDMFPGEYMDPPVHVITDDVVEAILDAPLPERPDWLYDVTMKHPVKNAYSTRRKLSRIDSITLHQTGCNLSERLKRWYFIRANLGVTRLGKVIKINGFDVIPQCSNWFNHRSIGIEISGNFRGVESNPRTLWKPGGRRATMSTAQISGARNAMVLCCNDVASAGGEIKHVFGHRQANGGKPNCPGELIWRNVALWAQKEIGLTSDSNYTKGSGLPIPRQWDPRSTHDFR